MRILDMQWLDNDDWWDVDEKGHMYVKDDAPDEAKKSYNHYLEQIKQNRD